MALYPEMGLQTWQSAAHPGDEPETLEGRDSANDIWMGSSVLHALKDPPTAGLAAEPSGRQTCDAANGKGSSVGDRKSTRLNSSHT